MINKVSALVLATVFVTACAPAKNGVKVQSREAKVTDNTEAEKSATAGGPNADESAKAQGFDNEQDRIAYLTPKTVDVKIEKADPRTSSEAQKKGEVVPNPNVRPEEIVGTIAGLVINPTDKKLWKLVGQQAWEIVRLNQPVNNVGTPPSVSVLPAEFRNWDDMEGFSAQPQAVTYQLVLKNLYGIKVVEQNYTVHYSHSGKYNGKGAYIANASVDSKVSVVWGFKLNSKIEVSKVVNTGTKDNPIPGLELKLLWDVKTILKSAKEADTFFLQGNGRITHVNSGRTTL